MVAGLALVGPRALGIQHVLERGRQHGQLGPRERPPLIRWTPTLTSGVVVVNGVVIATTIVIAINLVIHGVPFPPLAASPRGLQWGIPPPAAFSKIARINVHPKKAQMAVVLMLAA